MFKNVRGIFLIILWSTLNAVNSLQAQTVLPGIPFQMQARDRFNQAVRQQTIHVLSSIY